MPAFTKFDADAFSESRKAGAPPAKVANAAKVLTREDARLATLAALAGAAPDIRNCAASVWSERYTARAFEWFGGGRSWADAQGLAWGDLINEWHERHGRRWPTWQCAGCDEPIGGLAALNLPDGNRVHFDDIDCLINFGGRWRREAERGLEQFGLRAPDATATQW
jgi:hypothetical protein